MLSPTAASVAIATNKGPKEKECKDFLPPKNAESDDE